MTLEEHLQKMFPQIPTEQSEALLKLYRQSLEHLHPELEDFLEEGTGVFKGTKLLRHPLVFQVPFISPGIANEMLIAKQKQLYECLQTEKWHQYIFFHERPFRSVAFGNIEHNLDNETYWKLLSEIWVDNENIWQLKDKWTRFLKSKRPKRELFMSEEDRTTLASLPEELTIHRGWKKKADKLGFSWTLSMKWAQWFANRFELPGEVVTRKIAKKDIFAYINDRNEEEVIVLNKRKLYG